jgi:hypothetical protein
MCTDPCLPNPTLRHYPTRPLIQSPLECSRLAWAANMMGTMLHVPSTWWIATTCEYDLSFTLALEWSLSLARTERQFLGMNDTGITSAIGKISSSWDQIRLQRWRPRSTYKVRLAALLVQGTSDPGRRVLSYQASAGVTPPARKPRTTWLLPYVHPPSSAVFDLTPS